MENLEKLNYNSDEWYFVKQFDLTENKNKKADKNTNEKKTEKIAGKTEKQDKQGRHTKAYYILSVLLIVAYLIACYLLSFSEEDTSIIISIISAVLIVLALVIWFVDRQIVKKRSKK